jgi:hypothetical protein
MSLRELLANVPGVRKLAYQARRIRGRVLPHEITFGRVYRENGWGDTESVSGTGSNYQATAVLRRELPALWQRHNVRSLLDIPCGDFHWMREVVHAVPGGYMGMDVVSPLIADNRKRYTWNQRIHFLRGNILRTRLPAVDLILCRDCLVHFSYRDIRRALLNIQRSNANYLLTTTFPNPYNRDSITGDYWRPINLERPPFSFPKPIELLNEGCSEIGGECADKSLGLWHIRDLDTALSQ